MFIASMKITANFEAVLPLFVEPIAYNAFIQSFFI